MRSTNSARVQPALATMGKSIGLLLVAVAIAFGAVTMLSRQAAAAGESWVVPEAALTVPDDATSEIAVLSGGCFWGVQAVFQHTKGVTTAISGYSGGAASTAEYYTVGTGSTGHAETVQIYFNPQEISYAEILRIYFSVATDPTQLNRQGPDVGTQYSSRIYTTSDAQQQVAAAYIAQLNAAHVYDDAIVTTISPLDAFYPAEDYHQDYLTLHPTQPYIVVNDLPKLDNLMRLFPQYWRADPVTVAQTRPDLV